MKQFGTLWGLGGLVTVDRGYWGLLLSDRGMGGVYEEYTHSGLDLMFTLATLLGIY